MLLTFELCNSRLDIVYSQYEAAVHVILEPDPPDAASAPHSL